MLPKSTSVQNGMKPVPKMETVMPPFVFPVVGLTLEIEQPSV